MGGGDVVDDLATDVAIKPRSGQKRLAGPVEAEEEKKRKVQAADVEEQPNYKGLLDELVEARSNIDMKAAGFEVLEAGFANAVCAIERFGKPLVVKRYTELVFLRIDRASVGAVDVHAGQFGVGPRVYHSGLAGLVEERLPGRTLEEKDMHRGDQRLLSRVASAVAALHRLSVPGVCAGEPMLLRTMDKMLEVAAKKPELLPPEGVPAVDVIRAEVAQARGALEKSQARTVLGHGDCKPSNVIATANVSDPAMLIDFELGGPNYRGFDLFKLFRTASGFSEDSLKYFLTKYAESIAECGAPEDAELLLAETRMFEPLTWLEAAIFFLTMPHFKPEDTARWHHLAKDRWEKYEQTKSVLFAAA